jgi:hypothetical protein
MFFEHAAHRIPIDFAAGISRNFIDDNPTFGYRRWSQPFATPSLKTFRSFGRPFHEAHECSGRLSANGIRNPEGARFRNGRMTFQQRIDLCWLYFHSAAIDFVFDSTR